MDDLERLVRNNCLILLNSEDRFHFQAAEKRDEANQLHKELNELKKNEGQVNCECIYLVLVCIMFLVAQTSLYQEDNKRDLEEALQQAQEEVGQIKSN